MQDESIIEREKRLTKIAAMLYKNCTEYNLTIADFNQTIIFLQNIILGKPLPN